MSAQTPQEALADFPARYARTARFSLGAPRNLRVTAGGSLVVFCRARDPQNPTLCLWALDVATGAERLLVDPAELGTGDAELPPAERARRERARESASGIVDYSLDRAGTRACFALGGSLFVLELASGALRSPELAGTVFDPRLNGPGTAVAYVDGSDLRVVDLTAEPPTDRLLRADPDPAVSWGRAEFVAGEEMHRTTGYWWAPDGLSLLASRVDENPVGVWWIADPAHPERAPQPTRYPAAGTANAVVGLELVHLDGTGHPVDWNDGGRFEYLADVVWSPDHPPLVVRQTRDQRTVSLAEVALGDGAGAGGGGGTPEAAPDGGRWAVSERRAITDEVWVELIPGAPTWCDAGLLTVEDRADLRYLALDGRPLTGPGIQVRSIVGTTDDGSGGRAAVLTVWTEPSEVHLASVALPGADDGPGPVTLLTTAPGVHTGVLEGGTLVVSSVGPASGDAAITVHRLQGAGTGAPLGAPAGSIADFSAPAGFEAAPIFCHLGPDRLETALFLPTGHDGTTPLPVLLDPYGGPHAQRVLKAHNPHLVSRWFAEQGYAVVVTDGRGTPGRGPAWEREVWGDLAGPVLDDQLAALDAVLAEHPFLDAGRVGIRGWSFGGFLAALALLRRPDRFHAAVAGAPVTAWHLYDTHYTECYLGHPAEHPEHYRRSSLFTDGPGGLELPRQHRPLLLIHGLADDNVVAAHTLQFSTVLLAAGYPHQVLPLSGVTHMTPQVAVAENLLRLQLAFLDETLRP